MRSDVYAQCLEAIAQARTRVRIAQVYTQLLALPPGPEKTELLQHWALQQRLVDHIYDALPESSYPEV
jgi:hypothetical protein